MLKEIFLIFISFYQKYISKLLPSVCRFNPSCSQYAILAIEKYGVLRGTFFALKRLFRCNPFFPGGYDPLK